MRPAERLVPVFQEWTALHEVVDASQIAARVQGEPHEPPPTVQPVQRLSLLVARRVRHLRLLRRWTVDRLAAESGLDAAQLIQLECGKAPLHIVPAVERALGAPLIPAIGA